MTGQESANDQSAYTEMRPGIRAPLPAGVGGGTYDPMEARVARLEEDVKAIRSDLAVVKERVGHLPTAPMLVWGGLVFIITLVGGVTATVLGTGSYMSGTMSTALAAIQTVLAARPEPAPPPQSPTIIIMPSHARPISPAQPK